MAGRRDSLRTLKKWECRPSPSGDLERLSLADQAIDDEAAPWVHRAVRLTWAQADILLWSQVAHDIGIMPQAPVMSKLVDLERGVSVNATTTGVWTSLPSARNDIGTLPAIRQMAPGLDRPRIAEAFES